MRAKLLVTSTLQAMMKAAASTAQPHRQLTYTLHNHSTLLESFPHREHQAATQSHVVPHLGTKISSPLPSPNFNTSIHRVLELFQMDTGPALGTSPCQQNFKMEIPHTVLNKFCPTKKRDRATFHLRGHFFTHDVHGRNTV